MADPVSGRKQERAWQMEGCFLLAEEQVGGGQRVNVNVTGWSVGDGQL